MINNKKYRIIHSGYQKQTNLEHQYSPYVTEIST